MEGQLLREVAARSQSFFTVAATLQHLRATLGDTVASVRQLRAQVWAASPQRGWGGAG